MVALAVMGKESGSDGDTIEDPTQTFEYVTTAWSSTQEPNFVHQKARREHGGTPSWQESYVYSNGAGGVAMTKVQAEPAAATPSTPRWVGTGRTVLNNKGNPVKQYEPYFSATHAFEDEDDIVAWGVTPVIHYDAVGRAIRVDFPDGTYRGRVRGVGDNELPPERHARDENNECAGGLALE